MFIFCLLKLQERETWEEKEEDYLQKIDGITENHLKSVEHEKVSEQLFLGGGDGKYVSKIVCFQFGLKKVCLGLCVYILVDKKRKIIFISRQIMKKINASIVMFCPPPTSRNIMAGSF